MEGFNFKWEVEALGPANPGEIKDIIDEIEAEGNHFVGAPPLLANWPLRTDDPDSQVDPNHDPKDCDS